MIARRTVVALAVFQFVFWGISFYAIGVFGESIAAELGWSRPLVYGGFSVALLVMGLVSPLVGRLIDRFGGTQVMAAGALLCAIGCVGLAMAYTLVAYYAAWIVLGMAMRATLYEAAFAALARIGGPAARRPIAQITLLGGLSSSCFWPVGHALAEAFGWRAALLVYGGIALLAMPLLLAAEGQRYQHSGVTHARWSTPQATPSRKHRLLAALLYAITFALATGLSSAMSAHMIGLLTELGLAATLAVSVSALRGVGQSAARLAEVLFGGRLAPVNLNLFATLVLPLCFIVGLVGGGYPIAAAVFAFAYGAGNGILTITGGTLPLTLFDLRTYGAFVGRLLIPSFVLAAIAPLAFAYVIAHFGPASALRLSIAISLAIVAGAFALKALQRRLHQGPMADYR